MNAASLVLFALLNLAAADAPATLPGTQPLTWDGDLPLKMVDDLHAFADRETAASVVRRAQHWKRDLSSREAYEQSVAPNRARLAKSLGVMEKRRGDSFPAPFRPFDFETETLLGTYGARNLELVACRVTDEADAYAFRLSPDDDAARPRRFAIVVADPSFHLKGPPGSQPRVAWETAKQLRENGCDVFLLSTIDRRADLSTIVAGTKRTDQTHREFLFRQAFEMGRHPLGYEIDGVRTLIDWMKRTEPDAPIGIFGLGEGGRVALLTGALDVRVDAVVVCGAFGSQQRMWEDPIDRNLWGYLEEFGDAEVATLFAGRNLFITTHPSFEYTVPPPPRNVKDCGAPGELKVPLLDEVETELKRARELIGQQPDDSWFHARTSGHVNEDGTLINSLTVLLNTLGVEEIKNGPVPRYPLTKVPMERGVFSSGLELSLNDRAVQAWINHTQALVRESEYVRAKWWNNADRAARDPEKWKASCASYRKHLSDEVLGSYPFPMLPPNPRTRKIYDEPTYTGYEVVLDVFDSQPERPGVWAYGILLVPKGIKPGERRPVVVCQHGLEGRPQMLCEPGSDHSAYHRYAGQLAERGFVTFSPQNPYIGKDHFRQLVRKLWPLKKTLWSIIVPQHEQITDWLATLEFVDPARIGFYGLSYGGKTAMRVPALVDNYCLSICSGDFNEWIRKNTSVRDPFSYLGTHEYEMMEFDLGHTFNYAEMAYLIAPRPFMIERGHRDGVGIDEWVAYEFAKVRMLYADLKIPERAEIEFFDGPHTIHGVGTFDFLHKHLKWTGPKE